MKKILFVVAILGCVNVSAFAVTKCLNTSVIFNSCSNPSGSGSDFYVTCQGVSVRGVAFCGIGGTTTSQVTTSGTLGNNTNCWCRMISPAVSGNWVYAIGFNDEAACLNGCARQCASRFASNSNYLRTNLLRYLFN